MIGKVFAGVRKVLARLRRDKKGAALVEYALLIAGIALICLVAVSVLGHKTNDMIAAVASILPGAHTDDNGALVSGHLIETKYDSTSKEVKLDVDTIVSNSGTTRLGTNLGVDLSSLVEEPTP